MRLTRIEIRHFRSIRHLGLDLGDTTVFIGPNNVGKTAILDAVRLAVTRRWGQSGSRFERSDVGDTPDGNDGHGFSGASITLRAEESAPEEWPQGIADDLDPADGTESSDGRRSLVLRIRFGGAHKSDTFEESWELLDAEGEPICRHDALQSVDWMWRHFPVFYLSISREVDGTVLPRPGFWKECLKALEIPVGLEAQLVADGLGGELRKILEKLRVRGATGLTDEVLLETLRKEKSGYAAELADRIRGNRRIAQCAPEAFRAAIGMLPTLKSMNEVDGNAESAAGAPSGKTQAA